VRRATTVVVLLLVAASGFAEEGPVGHYLWQATSDNPFFLSIDVDLRADGSYTLEQLSTSCWFSSHSTGTWKRDGDVLHLVHHWPFPSIPMASWRDDSGCITVSVSEGSRPIAGVKVMLPRSGEIVRTDARGVAEFPPALRDGQLIVTVCAPEHDCGSVAGAPGDNRFRFAFAGGAELSAENFLLVQADGTLCDTGFDTELSRVEEPFIARWGPPWPSTSPP
jgi:hypothetical protein